MPGAQLPVVLRLLALPRAEGGPGRVAEPTATQLPDGELQCFSLHFFPVALYCCCIAVSIHTFLRRQKHVFFYWYCWLSGQINNIFISI